LLTANTFKALVRDQKTSKMTDLRKLKNKIESMTLNLGNKEANLIGASRGLLMLQDTYDLNILGIVKPK
jgi:hypothetical protein